MHRYDFLIPLFFAGSLLLFSLWSFQQAPETAKPQPADLEQFEHFLEYGELDSARQVILQMQRDYRAKGAKRKALDTEVKLAEVEILEAQELEQALQALQKVEGLKGQLSDEAHAYGKGLYVLAYAHFGEWEKAQALYQKLQPKEPDAHLHLLFELLSMATGGNAPEAVQFYAQAAVAWLEQHPRLKADTLNWVEARSYSAIAKDFQNLPDEALQIYEQLFPLLKGRTDLAALELLYPLYNDIAVVYQKLGDIGKSVEYYQKALLTMQGLPHTNSYYSNRITLLSNLAYNQELLGEYDAAIASNHSAIHVFKQTALPEMLYDVVFVWENLSHIYLYRKQLDSARKYFHLLQASQTNSSIISYGISTHLKAEFALAEDSIEAALGFYEQVREEFLEQGYSELDARNSSDAMLVNLYLLNQQPSQALDLIDINLRLLGSPSADLYPAFDSLAYPSEYLSFLSSRLEVAQDYPELINAHRFLEDARYAVQLLEHIRQRFTGNISKRELLKRLSTIYGYAIQAALNQNQPKQAFIFAEKAKSALLGEHLQERNALTQKSIPPALAEKEQALQRSLAYYSHQKFTRDLSEAETQKLQAKQLALKTEWRQLKSELEANYPQYYQLKYASHEPDVEAIQAQLPEKSLVLEYLETSDRLFIFALDREELQSWTVPLPKNYWSRVAAFQKALSDPYTYLKKPIENKVSLAQHGHALFELYLPYPQLLEKYEQLIIVPDGQMHYIPFEALLQKSISSLTPFKEWPFLIKDWEVSYLYTLQLWLSMRDKPAAPKSAMLAFAPSYKPAAANHHNDQNRQLRDQLQDLAGAQREVRQLEQSMSGHFYYGQGANEAQFKKQADGYQILHLAMHGVVDNEQPSYSNLVFTATNDGAANLLHAYEIQQMHLSADLAFLSACETGYGEYQAGEGVASLARSFMYAGVPSVVQSLWQVSDLAGADVVEDYYEGLRAGKNKSQALRDAKLAYLETAEEDQQHPFYWASFVQLGDTQPLQVASQSTIPWIWIASAGILVLLFLIWRWRK